MLQHLYSKKLHNTVDTTDLKTQKPDKVGTKQCNVDTWGSRIELETGAVEVFDNILGWELRKSEFHVLMDCTMIL